MQFKNFCVYIQYFENTCYILQFDELQFLGTTWCLTIEALNFIFNQLNALVEGCDFSLVTVFPLQVRIFWFHLNGKEGRKETDRKEKEKEEEKKKRKGGGRKEGKGIKGQKMRGERD